jgi:hypothetical protein
MSIVTLPTVSQPLTEHSIHPRNQLENTNNTSRLASEEKPASFKAFGNDGLTLWDILDIINPLQHVPGLSTLYRSVTNDQIDPAAKVAGGALYGGPLGFLSTLVDAVVGYNTGKELGEHALSVILPDPPRYNISKNTLKTGAKPPHKSQDYSVSMSNPYLASPRKKDFSTTIPFTKLQDLKTPDYGTQVRDIKIFTGKTPTTNNDLTETINRYRYATITYKKPAESIQIKTITFT